MSKSRPFAKVRALLRRLATPHVVKMIGLGLELALYAAKAVQYAADLMA